MAKTLQFRRDTTTNLASITGAEGELFVDLTKDTLVVMDGSTAGGFPLAKEVDLPTDLSDLTDSTNLIPTTLTDLGITDGANGQVLTTNGSGGFTFTTVSGGGGGSSNSFETIVVSGQSDVVADSSTDTLTLAAGSGISITTDAGADTITIAATGAANTGDFTFANTAISIPDFTDATINTHGNVTTSTTTTTSNSYTSGSGNWDFMTSFYYSSTTIYYNSSNSSDAFGQELAAAMPSGTTITITGMMIGTQTITTTSAFAYDSMDMRWEATVDTYTMMGGGFTSLSFSTSTTTETTSEQDFTYSFTQTGEFISDSALLGDVLVSDNILTPMPLISNDSYATETDQPIVINGDLEILGNVTGNLTVSGLFVSQQSAEVVANVTATSSGDYGVPLDFSTGAIFKFDNRSSSVSAINFTNIPKVADQVVTATVIIIQDSSGFMPSTFRVNGTSVTPYWSGGSAPAATASTIDILSFSILWISGTTYKVFASASNYAQA